MAQQELILTSSLKNDEKELELAIYNAFSQIVGSSNETEHNFIQEQIANNIDNFFVTLCRMIRKCPNDNIRNLIIVTIRKKLISDNEPPKFFILNKNTQVLFDFIIILVCTCNTKELTAVCVFVWL